MTCTDCGGDMRIDSAGASYHWGGGIDDIDRAADADHTAIPPEEELVS